MKIVWTTLAVQDIHHIRAYVSETASMRLANHLIDTIATAINNLPQYPQLGRTGRVRRTRELPMLGTPYIVVYRVLTDSIAILAVIHTARRWPTVM